MGKRGKGQNKGNKNPKRRLRDVDEIPEDVDDDIDACKIHQAYLCNCLIY